MIFLRWFIVVSCVIFPVWANAQAGVELFSQPARDGLLCNAARVEPPDDASKLVLQYSFRAPATGDARKIDLFTDTAGSPLMVTDTWFDWSDARPPVLALAVAGWENGSLVGRHLVVEGSPVSRSPLDRGDSGQLDADDLAAASELMRFLGGLRCPLGSPSDGPRNGSPPLPR